MLHNLIIPVLSIVGIILALPFAVFSQKSLKLNLEKELQQKDVSIRLLQKEKQKLVKTITVYGKNDRLDEVLTFDYDETGRVYSLKMEGSGNISALPENCTLYYEKKGNQLDLYGESSSINKTKLYTCTLNNMGYIIKETDLDSGSANEGVFLYTYDSDGQTISASYDGTPASFEWINGNVVKVTSILNESYTYTNVINKANINFNHLLRETYMEDMWGFALCGYLGNKDINLMASMRNINYNYLYDEEGYVIEIREGNNKYIISYDETIPADPDPTPSTPTTEEELEGAIGDAPEGSEDSPTEIFIPSDGITLEKPLDINKHIRLKGGKLIRSNDNPYAMLRIRSGYSLELEDITIDGNVLRQKDGTLIVYGKLKLKDGVSIKNCYRTEADSPSGAICVARGGVLTMNGGTISGNTGAYGSAVYNEGTFTMTDGEISANSGQIGTVVNNAGGEFIMTGGRISSNKVTDGCGGVFVSDNCTFTMTGGEISGNEDCDLYTWSDLQIGGPAKVSGLTLLNDGNRLLVNPALRNNWQISYVNTPLAGTIVATGRNGYRLAATDLQKIIYYNNVCQLKLSGNNIVTYQTGTGIDEINAVSFHLSVSDNRIQVEGLPAQTSFTIYEIGGRAVSTHTTDNSGQCNFSLESGIYLLNCKDQTKKFLVK